MRYVVSVTGCAACGDHEYRVKTRQAADSLLVTLNTLRDSTCTAKYNIHTEPDPEA